MVRIIGKKRKRRSDAGKPKPKRKAVVELDKDDCNMSGDDNQRKGPMLTKKTRSRKLAQTSAGRTKQRVPLPPKSKAVVDTDDDVDTRVAADSLLSSTTVLMLHIFLPPLAHNLLAAAFHVILLSCFQRYYL